MDEAPPFLPEAVELPPARPAKPPGPWNAWVTLALSAAIEGSVITGQGLVVVLVWFASFRQGKKPTYLDLAFDGDVMALATMLGVPIAVGLCVLFARLRRGIDVRDYLALRNFEWTDLGIGVGLMVGLQMVSGLAQVWLQHRENAEMLHVYESATWPAFLWVAVIFAAPLQEELLFRGFMYRGLAASRLGWLGASLICAAGWTLLHVQYDWLEMLTIFLLGLILGWLRHRSGSIWLPMMVHSLNNLAATVSIVLTLNEKGSG
ncbi:MAG TPA: type II CAAX endopeptidase family protein [Candidatus Limnocylindria bacterium]|jgi:membrane protease YdiL (CAAX protease family)|nr:type II CAAX endopeptidase family protein [Candidatus Limnocylindria bacterium]